MALTTLIFDLDGTLIDSAPDLRTACNKLLQRENRREITLAETKKFVGNGAAKLVARAFAATGEPVEESELVALTQDFLAFYDGHEADETQTYPSVMETLQKLKEQGYRMALCTNKPQQPTQNLVKQLGLESFFEFIIGGDQVGKKKPDPEMLLSTLKHMGLSPDQAVMIGDSPNDIGAADNADIPSIAVSYGYRRVSVEELGADRIIDHMAQLPDALEAMKA